MIARFWKGYTILAKAYAYEALLKNEIFPAIQAKKIDGFINISLLRRELQDSVEFVTIMKFKDINAVKDFVGNDYHKSYVPEKAKQLLRDYDREAKHYNLIVEASD